MSSLWRKLSLKQACSISNKKEFEQICLRGDYLSVIRSKFNKNWILHGFRRACTGGHKDIVDLMIKKGAYDLNRGLANAVQNGHRDIVELLVEKGANDFDRGYHEARKNGRQDIMKLLIEMEDKC